MSVRFKSCLNSNQLKLIAVLAMTVDHLAWAFFPGYPVAPLPLILHLIGRVTCPIMCFFVAEGYHYTKNINKYTARLFLFALLSHFCYLYASPGFSSPWSFLPFSGGSVLNQTSVMWSLAWGLVLLRVVNSEKIRGDFARILCVLLICLVSFPSDWSCIAAMCVMAFGTNRGNFRRQAVWMTAFVAMYAVVYFFAIDRLYGILQMGVVLSLPLLALYNGKRGRSPGINCVMKWLFYLYYPLHLLLIGLWLHIC